MHIVRGSLASGLGEGRYYISRRGYRRQFNETLGFEPYPGTLNLRLSEPFLGAGEKCVTIDGFSDEGRSFGGCICYPVRIQAPDGMSVLGAIVRPERTGYPPDLVEVIAPVNLRRALNLSEGDEVELILE